MKIFKNLTLVLPVVFAMITASCSNDSPDPDNNPNGELPPAVPYTAVELTTSQQKARHANNELALDLIQNMMAMQGDGSIVASPFSLGSVIAMLANGDNDTTRDRILELLGYEKGQAGVDQLNDFYALLIDKLPKLDSRAYALVSNSIWLNNDMPVLDSFKQTVGKWYKADVFSLPDLTSDITRKQINDWCSDKTNGMIPEFLEYNLISSAIALINATYFKGFWTEGFDKKNTSPSTFTNVDGTQVQVEMMNNTVTGAYYNKTEDAQILGMNYGNGNFRMTCILPVEGLNLKDYVSKVSSTSLIGDINNCKHQICEVAMPKFDIRTHMDITSVLRNMGFDCMMDPGFNAISPTCNLNISQVLQETRVISDEVGTIAAATTMAGMDIASGATYEEVTLNRPFLFVIEETSTNTILFTGVVSRL